MKLTKLIKTINLAHRREIEIKLSTLVLTYTLRN